MLGVATRMVGVILSHVHCIAYILCYIVTCIAYILYILSHGATFQNTSGGSNSDSGVSGWLDRGSIHSPHYTSRDTSLFLTDCEVAQKWEPGQVVNFDTCCELRHHSPPPSTNLLLPYYYYTPLTTTRLLNWTISERLLQTFPHKSIQRISWA